MWSRLRRRTLQWLPRCGALVERGVFFGFTTQGKYDSGINTNMNTLIEDQAAGERAAPPNGTPCVIVAMTQEGAYRRVAQWTMDGEGRPIQVLGDESLGRSVVAKLMKHLRREEGQ